MTSWRDPQKIPSFFCVLGKHLTFPWRKKNKEKSKINVKSPCKPTLKTLAIPQINRQLPYLHPFGTWRMTKNFASRRASFLLPVATSVPVGTKGGGKAWIQWSFLVPLIGGRWYIYIYYIYNPPIGKDYKWYISGIYCQLGDYMVPTTY